MREAQRGFKHCRQSTARCALLCCVAFVQLYLGKFKIPVAKLVPDEFVDRAGGLVKAVGGEGVSDFGDGLLQTRGDPPVRIRILERV